MMEANRLQVSMVGSGNPYAVLTDLRKQIIRALHNQHTLSDIQRMFDLSAQTLSSELEPLVKASLITPYRDTYRPQFLILDENETRQVVQHANQIGIHLFKQLQSDWSGLSQAYSGLRAGENTPFLNLSFLLVGACILDIGLLECLAVDATLMPKAPHRPDQDNPEARYYFWMLEGDPNDGGKYGQNTIGLQDEGWCFFTFGQYYIGLEFNEERSAYEQNVLKTRSNPSTLANELSVTTFDRDDVTKWQGIVEKEAMRLLAVYLEHEGAIRDLYVTLKSSETLTDGFGEFFCLYHHLVFSHVIDLLEEAILMCVPDQRFMGAFWHGNTGWV